MDLILVLIHVFLAIVLFIVANWIGKHSSGFGYIRMSIVIKQDETPAFNFIYRAFAPIVFITICSAIFYKLNLVWIIENIYLVVIYYFFIRLLFNIFTGRSKLLNWGMQLSYWITSIPLSYFVYKSVIIPQNGYLFLDDKNLGTALWLSVAAFIYKVFNSFEISTNKAKKRKSNYINHRYKHYQALYGDIIEKHTVCKRKEALIYSILLYEAFNRPKVYRWIERLTFKLGISKTLGVMQVTTKEMITDKESVEISSKKIVYDHFIVEEGLKRSSESDEELFPLWKVQRGVIALYNNDEDYIGEVESLYTIVIKKFYPGYESEWDLAYTDFDKLEVFIEDQT